MVNVFAENMDMIQQHHSSYNLEENSNHATHKAVDKPIEMLYSKIDALIVNISTEVSTNTISNIRNGIIAYIT